MIKRIAANLVIDSNYVVNAYGFKIHLPVGRLKYSLIRLQELGIDEINILNTTHSDSPSNDINLLLNGFDDLHISTPLAYGGGISNLNDATQVIKNGVERVIISPKIFFNQEVFGSLCNNLGDQAIVLHLPIKNTENGLIINGYTAEKLSDLIRYIPKNWGGEILITFVNNDGKFKPDWEDINNALRIFNGNSNLILSGGFACYSDIALGLNLRQVSSISVGNYLHRIENSVYKIKNNLNTSIEIRM
jgi:cyclase